MDSSVPNVASGSEDKHEPPLQAASTSSTLASLSGLDTSGTINWCGMILDFSDPGHQAIIRKAMKRAEYEWIMDQFEVMGEKESSERKTEIDQVREHLSRITAEHEMEEARIQQQRGEYQNRRRTVAEECKGEMKQLVQARWVSIDKPSELRTLNFFSPFP